MNMKLKFVGGALMAGLLITTGALGSNFPCSQTQMIYYNAPYTITLSKPVYFNSDKTQMCSQAGKYIYGCDVNNVIDSGRWVTISSTKNNATLKCINPKEH